MQTTVSMFLATLLALALLSPLAIAHSWVEEYQLISDNGTFTGPRGYTRGYVSRTDPTYNGFSMMWMLPSLDARNTDGTVRTRINDTDLVCHPAQRTSNYTATFPKLQVSPGDYVAMKYLENGHVSLPWNITGKPPGGGSVFIFGTTQPSDTEKITDVMQWTRDGKGGNGNGFLMTAQNFDDGRCHQINCGSISQARQMLQPNHVAGQPTSTVESWCENDLLIPETVAPGTLTTYWIWQFETEANMDCNTPAGKDEYYTSCADFDVVDKSAPQKQLAAAPLPAEGAEQTNPQTAAVSNYKSRTAYTTSPPTMNLAANKAATASPSPSVDPAFVSSCSAQAPIISSANLNMWPEVYVPNSCGVISSFGTAAEIAWQKTWDAAASSYTAGAASAWKAAFAGKGVVVPDRNPVWSVVPGASGTDSMTIAAEPTASGYGAEASPAATSTSVAVTASLSATATSLAPSGYSSSGSGEAATAEAASLTTIVTVVTLTSTLPVSQMSAPSSSASSSSPLPAAYSISSSLLPSSASAYSEPSSSSSPSSSSESGSSAPGISIPTISTISSSAPSPTSSESASSTPSSYAPTVAANGTITSYRRHRRHPRSFSFWGH